ncbi:unnamed protein product [Haemonchus placei]|uniref:Uncharacterized protein n=1 Tax=Haemonchus placei TaxID=6290 RepID=A0A158QJX8_HAEPC|nr:unnamed protein product [Haemonchus placei]
MVIVFAPWLILRMFITNASPQKLSQLMNLCKNCLHEVDRKFHEERSCREIAMSRFLVLILLVALLSYSFATTYGQLHGYGSYGPAWRRRLWRAEPAAYDDQMTKLLNDAE